MTVRKSLQTLILILGLSSFINLSSAKNLTCAQLVTRFSNVSTAFLNCVIENAEPVIYCRKCGSNGFASVILKYNDLVAKEECKVKYFDQDRLKVIEMAYSNAESMWVAGSCSNCYDWVDGSNDQNISETTTTFFNELANFELCVDKYDNKTVVCGNCIDNYNKVNEIYKNIQKNTNDNFCFDIKDAMNKTRLNWSHNLGCCKDRKTSLTTFIVTGAIISALIPFVFYSSFMFFGWRREQLDEPLIDSDIQPSTSTNGQSVETNERSAVPAITQLLDVE